jgi:hypothetical protein
MTTHRRWPPLPGPSLYSLLVFLLLSHQHYARALIVTVIENTDPRISYLPSVCNNTGVQTSCTAPWFVELETKSAYASTLIRSVHLITGG